MSLIDLIEEEYEENEMRSARMRIGASIASANRKMRIAAIENYVLKEGSKALLDGPAGLAEANELVQLGWANIARLQDGDPDNARSQEPEIDRTHEEVD